MRHAVKERTARGKEFGGKGALVTGADGNSRREFGDDASAGICASVRRATRRADAGQTAGSEASWGVLAVSAGAGGDSSVMRDGVAADRCECECVGGGHGPNRALRRKCGRTGGVVGARAKCGQARSWG